jgi:hypothetical protein
MQVMSKSMLYENIRKIEASKPVHHLHGKNQFQCYAEKYADEICKMCEELKESQYASTTGLFLLEKTGNSVFREDRDDVRNSWRTSVKTIVRLQKSPPASLEEFEEEEVEEVNAIAVAHDNLISTLNNELADLKNREKEIKRTLRALNEFKP